MGGLRNHDLKRIWVERGSIIKRRRETLGWEREDLARHAGVPLNFVVLIELGEMDAPHAVDKIRETIGAEQYRRLNMLRGREVRA